MLLHVDLRKADYVDMVTEIGTDSPSFHRYLFTLTVRISKYSMMHIIKKNWCCANLTLEEYG